MNYLKKLTKNDLSSLLSICRQTRDVDDTNQLENLFRKLKTIILFDSAAAVYIGNEVLSKTDEQIYRISAMEFSKEFIDRYIKELFYRKSAICQELFNSWNCINWKNVWSKGLTDKTREAKQFAIDYGYLDGWVAGRHSSVKERISAFVLTGQKVGRDIRSTIMINHLKPHITEAVSDIFEKPLKKDKAVARWNITPRELDILRWYEEGKSVWDISIILNLSERTIKWHTSNIFKKLDALNRSHAIAIALRHGLID